MLIHHHCLHIFEHLQMRAWHFKMSPVSQVMRVHVCEKAGLCFAGKVAERCDYAGVCVCVCVLMLSSELVLGLTCLRLQAKEMLQMDHTFPGAGPWASCAVV